MMTSNTSSASDRSCRATTSIRSPKAKAGLGLHSKTIQAIGEEYAVRRKQAQRTRLRWRVSGGPRRSLGWIPFKASAIRYRNGQLFFAGTALSLWDSYGLSRYKLGAGNLSEDARGRWYLNVTIKIEKTPKPATGEVERSVGLDLGLKDFAATSDGRVITLARHYRKLEAAQAKAQRAKRKERVRALHAKIKKLTGRPVAQAFHGARGGVRRDLHRQRERFGTRENTDGEIRARRRLKPVPDHAAVQVR
ncbi:transposase [Paraburkholderia sp. Cpub6]|uniref:transposase n=1 Tax=Paraburkholderia sp. Cpub6 TaxID=2723094 RepID=UPI00161631F1|nr:transposase [Paraburkholderia sp. Cpub6]MBB5460245.1 transposase [Paraburkholderia sp. Cpub6]